MAAIGGGLCHRLIAAMGRSRPDRSYNKGERQLISN